MAAKLPPDVEVLVREALAQDASDLFLLPGEPPALRLRGVLHRMDAEALTAEAVRAIATAMIGEENLAKIGPDIAKFERWCGAPGEFNLSVCVARAHGDYTIVFRVMPSRIFSVEEMLFPESMIKAAMSPYGLVVVAGLAGSGKTTGLYGLADYINAHRDGCHICTVEGPSHMLITPKKAMVQQREIGVDVPNALAGIQAAMAQDLDVLLIGEITTLDELQACITVADTGHLVLMQLHASTPQGAIQRMLDVFPEEVREVSRKALAGVLRGVSAQRLLPKANGKGRAAAYGVLIPDDEMRQAIIEGRDLQTRRTPLPDGCQTMAEHINRLLAEGVISEDTAAKALDER